MNNLINNVLILGLILTSGCILRDKTTNSCKLITNYPKDTTLVKIISSTVINSEDSFFISHKWHNSMDTFIYETAHGISINSITNKVFDIDGQQKMIVKILLNHPEIHDSNSSIFLLNNEQVLILKSEDWLTFSAFACSDLEQKLIDNILVDSTGFY